MGLNVGYLTCNKTSSGDEVLTPFYAVAPLLKYLEKDKIIWCPFDKRDSAFVQTFNENGYKIVFSHIEDGKDFFKYEPPNWDIIVSNPPFSKKDLVLKRCYELGKPFALLLPVNSIQGKFRVDLFLNYGLELLIFDGRVDYHTNGDKENYKKGCHFGSAYFCNKLLPSKICLEKLEKYNRSLEL